MDRYYDGRNPYGSRGGYVRDRAGYDMRGSDYDMRRMDYAYDSRSGYPTDDRRDYAMDRRGYGRDYGMSPEELMTWSRRLYEEVDEKDKQALRMEQIEKKAYDLGIRFDHFSPEEFYTTVLMIFTDFKDVLGTANTDIYLKLAKAWLCDEDVAVRYADKLCAYFKHVVYGV